MNVTSVRVWPVQNGGSLIGSAAVVLDSDSGDIAISRIRVVRRKDGGAFVALPSDSYEKDGDTHYVEVIRLPSRLMKEIEFQIFKELGL
jgi:DNA-binding cell septation regulator SpoVG